MTDALQEEVLEAGREADARVAVEVMGWMPEKCASVDNRLVRKTRDGAWRPLPRFSTDIAAAWLIIDELARRGIVLYLDMEIHEGKQEYSLGLWDGELFVGEARADTASLAICRAALAATAKTPTRNAAVAATPVTEGTP